MAIFETYGTIRADGTLDLEQKLSPLPGRVKVRVEAAEAPAKPPETILAFVDRTRNELQASGHKFMNDAEVTAWVDELRTDDDRIGEIYRQASEGSKSP